MVCGEGYKRLGELQKQVDTLKKRAKEKVSELQVVVGEFQRRANGDFPEDDIRFLKDFIEGTEVAIKACKDFQAEIGSLIMGSLIDDIHKRGNNFEKG